MAARTRGVVIRRTRLSGAPMVVIDGELDIATAQALEEALDAAIRETEGVLLLDVAEVTFMDSSALNVLLRARSLLGREDRPIALVAPAAQVRSLLELAGVADLFALYESREAASRALAPARGGCAAAPAAAEPGGAGRGGRAGIPACRPYQNICAP